MTCLTIANGTVSWHLSLSPSLSSSTQTCKGLCSRTAPGHLACLLAWPGLAWLAWLGLGWPGWAWLGLGFLASLFLSLLPYFSSSRRSRCCDDEGSSRCSDCRRQHSEYPNSASQVLRNAQPCRVWTFFRQSRALPHRGPRSAVDQKSGARRDRRNSRFKSSASRCRRCVKYWPVTITTFESWKLGQL